MTGKRAAGRLMAVALAAAFLATPGRAAAAAQHLHGVILALTPHTGEAIVRHDAFAGMPSMTMPFRIVPRARIGELQPGNTIDATVDTRTEPWTLRDVTVATTEAVTATSLVPRVAPLKLGDTVPDTPFVDQNGHAFRLSHLRGDDVLLAFIYTRCQDPQMCPLISAKFNALQRARGARRLRLVEVTLDPSYDRPPVLARYGAMFGADPRVWTLAVGDATPTLDFAARFGIVPIPDPAIGLIHAENTVEIDPDGRIANMIYDARWQPDALLTEIDARRDRAANLVARLDRWLSRTAVALCGPSVAALGGAGDLAIVLATFLALAYVVFRLARGIFAKSA